MPRRRQARQGLRRVTRVFKYVRAFRTRKRLIGSDIEAQRVRAHDAVLLDEVLLPRMRNVTMDEYSHVRDKYYSFGNL